MPRHRLRHVRAARRAHGGGAPVHRRERLQRGAATRSVQGDASTRSYERLALGDKRVILMNSPRRPGRPAGARRQALQRDRASRRERRAVRGDGGRRCASAASRRRRSTTPISTRGCCIIEDLGDERVVERRSAGADRGALRDRGRRAARAASRGSCPTRCRSRRSVDHRIPALRHGRLPDRSRAAARLVPAAARRSGAGQRARRVRRALARGCCSRAIDAPPTWVLRDFHSPNLLWLPRAQRASPASACSTSRMP